MELLFSLTQLLDLNSVELVVSSLTERYNNSLTTEQIQQLTMCMSVPVETQWRGRWKGEMDYLLWLTNALIASHTHWSFQWGLCSQGKANSNSLRGLLQQGLQSGGQLAGGKKSVHGFADFFYVSVWRLIILKAWCNKLCMRLLHDLHDINNMIVRVFSFRLSR